jgi:hypothetical protein
MNLFRVLAMHKMIVNDPTAHLHLAAVSVVHAESEASRSHFEWRAEDVLPAWNTTSFSFGSNGASAPVDIRVLLCPVCGQRVLHLYPEIAELELPSTTS